MFSLIVWSNFFSFCLMFSFKSYSLIWKSMVIFSILSFVSFSSIFVYWRRSFSVFASFFIWFLARSSWLRSLLISVPWSGQFVLIFEASWASLWDFSSRSFFDLSSWNLLLISYAILSKITLCSDLDYESLRSIAWVESWLSNLVASSSSRMTDPSLAIWS